MNSLEFSPTYWQAKADEARAVADTLQSEIARRHMLLAAASYDRLAELAQRHPANLYVVQKPANAK